MELYPSETTIEAVARFVREEASRLVESGGNWKIILNGSSGGDVRAVVERYQDLTRRSEQVKR